MSQSSLLTVGQLAEIYGLPAWKICRAVDALDVEIPCAGLYRLIPRDLLGAVAVELQRRGWLAFTGEVATR